MYYRWNLTEDFYQFYELVILEIFYANKTGNMFLGYSGEEA